TPNLVLERTFNDPDTGDAVMQQSIASVNRATQMLTVTWIYDRIDRDSVVRRQVAPLTLRYVMASEIRLMLKMAGMDQVELRGDYDFSRYEEGSPRLLVTATQAGNES